MGKRAKEAEQVGILLVTCPDRKGIVATLAQVLYGQGLNILDSDQHADPVAGVFFQRLRFELAGLKGDLDGLRAAIAETAERFGMDWRLELHPRRRNVALFVSRYDHCLYDLLLRQRAGELDCEIALVVGNHPDLEPVARQFDVPYHVFPIDPETKREQERKELALLAEHDVELVVLARYMQVLSGEFLAAYPHHVINIHHSFLPAFVGGRPYRQAYERGVKLIGATAHYVTEDLDEGPIIEQDVVRCSHRDRVADLTRKGRDLEKLVLARAVRWHLEDRILVYGRKTVVLE